MKRVLLCIVLLGLWHVPASSTRDCKAVVAQHLRTRTKKAVPYHPDSIVFFLHVPRTAGRTFHTCLLKPGTPEARRCPRAYDHLRIKADMPKCNLLSSHDDFSVVDVISTDLTVVTQMRDPVDRILSAYEFAIELAARALKRKKPAKRREGRVVTEDVWPWSYFIPWFKNDLQQREAELSKAQQPDAGGWVEREAADGRVYHFNKHLNATRWPEQGAQYTDLLPALDPYNNPLFMPLEEFIKHPIAHELLHEGGLLQVLGTSNYSHFEEAAAVRECLFSNQEAHTQLLQVALERLDTFSHVGLMDRLDESVRSAAASLRFNLKARAFISLPPRRGGRDRQMLSEEGAGDEGAAAAEGQEGAGEAGAPRPAEDDDDDNGDGDADEYAGGEQPDRAEGGAAAGNVEQGEEAVSGGGEEGASGEPLDGDVDGAGLEQPDAAGESLAQATHRLEDAHNDLLHGLQNGATSRQVHRLRKGLDEAKKGLRNAQDTLLEGHDVRPARKIQQQRDNKGRLRTRDPLAVVYRRCMARSHQRNKGRKQASLALLQMPDGRTARFSKEARAAIPEHVIKAIRDLNPGDTALYAKAQALLRARMDQYEKQGTLQDLPERKPSRPMRGRTRLQELQQAAGAEMDTMSSRASEL